MTQAFSIVRDISRSVVRNVPVSLGGLELFSPADLFASGEDGGWYDPSDLTSMYVGRNGSGGNPSVGSVVGMVLDKSQMGGQTAASFIAGQPESLPNGDFTDGNITGWTDASTTPADIQYSSVDGGSLFLNANGNTSRARISITTVVGRFYRLTIVSGASSTTSVSLDVGTTAGASDILSVSVTSGAETAVVFKATSTTTWINFYRGATQSIYITNVSVKEIPGNHLVAPSDAARPVLRDEIVDGTSVDVSGQPELVTNGTFDTGDFTGFSSSTGWTVSGGGAAMSSNLSSVILTPNFSAPDDFSLLTFDIIAHTAGRLSVRGNGGAYNLIQGGFNAVGSYSVLIPRGNVPSFIRQVETFTGTIDNISVREVPASAARRYYLDFDGVDDALFCSFPLATLSATSTFVTSWTTSDTKGVMHGEDLTNADYAFIFEDANTVTNLQSNSASGTEAAYYRVNGVDNYEFGVSDRDDAHTWLSTGSPVVAAVQFSATGWSGFAVSYFAGWYVVGKWYGAAFIDRALTTAERYQLEYVLAQDSGVTYVAPVLDGVPTIG